MNSAVKKYVQDRVCKAPTIVEIGAHYGEDTLDLLKIFRHGRVYCFEPDPRNAVVFRDHVKSRRAALCDYAVSNVDSDDVDFYQAYDENVSKRTLAKYGWIDKDYYISQKLNASGASSLKQGHKLVKNADVVKVKTIRIDTWAWSNGINEVDFMWIDVQGAEREVIQGLGYMVTRIKYIWIECGETDYDGAMNKQQTIAIFSDLGFSPVQKFMPKKQKGDLLFLRGKT